MSHRTQMKAKDWRLKREKRLAREVRQHVKSPRFVPVLSKGDRVVYEDKHGTVTALDQDWVLWAQVRWDDGVIAEVRVANLVRE